MRLIFGLRLILGSSANLGSDDGLGFGIFRGGGGVLTQPPPRGLPPGNGPSAVSCRGCCQGGCAVFVWMVSAMV